MTRKFSTIGRALLAMSCLALNAEAQSPAIVKVEATPEKIEIGDRINATLTLVWMGEQPTDPPRFPTWQEAWGKAEILHTSKVDAFTDQSGRHIYEQELELIVFEAGEIELPAVTLAVPLAEETVELSSDPFPLSVASVLPEEDPQEPLEAKPVFAPRTLHSQQLANWASAGLGALVLLAALLWMKLASRSMPQPGRAEIILDPLPELEAQLDRIRLDDGSELAHTTLSHALRRFLARTLNFAAVEYTTSQIQLHLREADIESNDSIETMKILRSCDLVKFAKREVAPAVTADRITAVRSLVQRVDQHLSVVDNESNEDQQVQQA